MKKIYDIIPPNKVENILKPKEVVNKKDKIKPKIRFPFRFVFIVLIIGVIYGFFMDSKAEVIIYPKTDSISGEEIIIVSSKQGIVDLENKIIPAVVFKSTENYNDDYVATGITDKDIKAKGTIRVFNKLSPVRPLTLIKGTRFLDKDGNLIYRAISGFTIPQAKIIDGKLVEGFIDIEVEADEAGEKYNINLGTFSVPGLVGTEHYSNIWAQVISPLTGGFKSEVSVVLAKDLENAQAQFKEEFLEKNQKDLKDSIPDNYIIIDKYFSSVFENIIVGAKTGEEVASFSVSGTVKTEVITFRKEDIENVLNKSLKERTSEIKQIATNSLKYEFLENNLKDGRIEIKVSFSGNVYWLPDDSFLLQSILGKEMNYSLSLLENIPEIEKAEIKLRPFFKTNNPNNRDNVEIKLDFN